MDPKNVSAKSSGEKPRRIISLKVKREIILKKNIWVRRTSNGFSERV